jgi:DNA-binding NarL/FixJ family response regulator
MYDNDQVLESLIGAGARGYLLKSDANSHLVDAVAALAARKPFFTARLSETTRNSVLSARNGRKSVLTSRERDVAQLIADGHTNKQIADALTIGLKTVEAHRAAIMRKLELSSSAALVRYAIRNGIVRL